LRPFFTNDQLSLGWGNNITHLSDKDKNVDNHGFTHKKKIEKKIIAKKISLLKKMYLFVK